MNEATRNKVFWVFNIYHFVNDAIVFLLPAIMKNYFSEFGLNHTQTDILFIVHVILIVSTQILVGYLADKSYESKLFIIGSIITTISTLSMFLSQNFNSLLLLIIFNGIGLGFIHALIYVTGSKLFPKDRERKMAIQASVGDLGKMLGILTAVLVEIINPNQWRLPLLIWGTLCISVIIFGIKYLPNISFKSLNANLDDFQNISEVNNNYDKNDKNNSINQSNTKFFSKEIILLLLLFSFYSGTFDVIIKHLTIFFQNERNGLSSQYSTLLLAVTMGIGTIGVYLSGKIKTFLGLKKFITILFSINLFAMILFLILNLDNLFVDIIFCAIFGYCILSIYVGIQSELSFYVHFKNLGLGFSVLFGAGWLGGALWLAIAGPMADLIDSELMYFYLGIFLTVITIILSQFIPERKTNQVL